MILFSITFVGYTDMILTFIYTAAIVFDPTTSGTRIESMFQEDAVARLQS